MKKIRKYLAVALALGLMLSGMTVLAAGSYGTDGVIHDFGNRHHYMGAEEPSASNTPAGQHPVAGDTWHGEDGMYTFDGMVWKEGYFPEVYRSSSSSSSSSSKSLNSEEKAEIAAAKEKEEAERKALEQAGREAVMLEAEADEEGFENAAQMQCAKAADKTAGEYYNNAVLDTQGIEEATPVAQGGNLIVDGKVTNMTASISKAPVAFVDSVRADQEGTVLNVVDVQFPAAEAVINFYMPGVTEGANIAAVQYINGAWVDVNVKEVRVDHVILDLKSNGVVAFLEK